MFVITFVAIRERIFIVVCRLRRGEILFAFLALLESKSVSPVGFFTDE